MSGMEDGETLADYWRDVTPLMKAESKARREKNRRGGAELLTAAGIRFDSRNNGAHLVAYARGHTFDFWPGTGLWIMWGSTQRHRGVRRLIKFIQQLEAA